MWPRVSRALRHIGDELPNVLRFDYEVERELKKKKANLKKMYYRLRPLHYHTKNRHSKKKEQNGLAVIDEIEGVVLNLKSRLDFLTSEIERLTAKLNEK